MRSRNIKPSFFKNEILGTIDPFLSIVFAGLWCAADREGRIEDRSLRLKAELLPYRENIDFNVYLTELTRLGFIRRYECDGIKVIEVINFLKHQNPHKTEKPSELPVFTDSCTDTVKYTLNNTEITEPARLIPDSLLLIPDVLIPDVPDNGKSPVSSLKPQKATKIKKDFSVSTEMAEWAAKGSFTVDIHLETEKFIDHFISEGKTKIDWVATWRNWIRKASEFKKERKPAQHTGPTFSDGIQKRIL